MGDSGNEEIGGGGEERGRGEVGDGDNEEIGEGGGKEGEYEGEVTRARTAAGRHCRREVRRTLLLLRTPGRAVWVGGGGGR